MLGCQRSQVIVGFKEQDLISRLALSALNDNRASNTYRSVSSAEPRNSGRKRLRNSFWQGALDELIRSIPEFLVLVLEENDCARGLHVESAGNVLDGLGDDLLNARVGDGGGVRDAVDGAAGNERVEEGVGSHCDD